MNLFSGKVKTEGHEVLVDVFRAEALAPMDLITKNVDGYINAKYSGVAKGTKVVTSANPEWNQRLVLACGLPNQSKFISIEAWDHDLAGFLIESAKDDLIGCFKVKFADIKEKKAVPRWSNIYGPPLSSDGPHADLMTLYGQEQGSHYRGRVLYQVTSQFSIDPKTVCDDLKFKFPENPMPVSSQRTYILRVDVMEGHELPQRDAGIVHISIGPYCIYTKGVPIDNGRCLWYESLEDKRVTFPVDVEEIPDIIFYFADQNEEYRRHSFARIKASTVFVTENDLEGYKAKPRVVKLAEDRSLDLVTDDEFPGFLFVKVYLFAGQPPPRQPVSQGEIKYVDYQLRVHLYVGRNIPPADETGTSDPFVLVRSAGQTATSQICYATINPGWYETMTLDVSLPEFKEDGVPSGMSLVVYDDDEGKERELIGRSWVEFKPFYHYFKLSQGDHAGEVFEIIYGKPKWLNILYDATGDVCGKLLAGYALIKKEDAEKIPIENLYPDCFKETLHLFCIGLRDIDMSQIKAKIASVAFDVSGDEFFHLFSYDPIQTKRQKIAEGGININKYLSIKLDIPRNRQLCAVLDVYAYEHSNSGEQKLLGVGTIEMSEFVDKYIFEKDEGEQSSLDALNKLGDLMPKGKLREYDDIDDNELPIAWELPFKKKIVPDEEFSQLIDEKEKSMLGSHDKSGELNFVIGEDSISSHENMPHKEDLNFMNEQQADLLKSLNANKIEDAQRIMLMSNLKKNLETNQVNPKTIQEDLLAEEEEDLLGIVKEKEKSRSSFSQRNSEQQKEFDVLREIEKKGTVVSKKETHKFQLNSNVPIIVSAQNENEQPISQPEKENANEKKKEEEKEDEKDVLLPKENKEDKKEIDIISQKSKPSSSKPQSQKGSLKASLKSQQKSIHSFQLDSPKDPVQINLEFPAGEGKVKFEDMKNDPLAIANEKQERESNKYQSIASDGRIRLKTMRLHSQVAISEASKVSSRALSIRDLPPENNQLAEKKLIRSKKAKSKMSLRNFFSLFGSKLKMFGKALSRKALLQMKMNDEHYEEYVALFNKGHRPR